ncbi:MAG: hypothetical protein RL095_941 [Verrucomicrobiota bacterium]|jgi:zinc/manganese transport system substrate-binding protein
MKLSSLILALLTLLSLGACDGAPAAGGGRVGEKLPVVASFSIIGDWVKEIGGDKIDLEVMAKAGTDPHAYEAVPSDARALSRAKVVFSLGLGFDEWCGKAALGAGTRARQVSVGEVITARVIDKNGGETTCHGCCAHKHSSIDPHAFHSIAKARQMCARICEILSSEDKSNAAYYQSRLAAYDFKLVELENWARKELEALPKERRLIASTHDTFGYFAADYDFRRIGVILKSFSTEAPDPAASDLKELCQKLREAKIPAIFGEAPGPDKLAATVAGEIGIKMELLHCDGLGPDTPSYEAMFRSNLSTMIQALK